MINFLLAQLNQTDHDLLILLNEKMNSFQTIMSNHLAHHFVYTLALVTAFLSLLSGIALVIWKQQMARQRESIRDKQILKLED